jgi:hypothetical protein
MPRRSGCVIMGSMVIALMLSVLIEARRGGLPALLGGLWLLALGAADLAATLVPTASHETRLLAFAAFARPLTAFVLAVFVVGSLRREADDRVQPWLVACDRPRHHYLAGRALGGAVLALASAGALTLLLLPFVSAGHALLWGSGLACELLLVVLLAQAVGLAIASPAVALAAIALTYLLARMLDALRLLARVPLLQGSGDWGGGDWLTLVASGLDALAWVLPALARFAPGAWLIAPEPPFAALGYVLPQTAVSALLLWALMRVDFARRSW